MRWVELPREHNGKRVKDISDLREAHESAETFLETLLTLERRSRPDNAKVVYRVFDDAGVLCGSSTQR